MIYICLATAICAICHGTHEDGVRTMSHLSIHDDTIFEQYSDDDDGKEPEVTVVDPDRVRIYIFSSLFC